MRTKILFIIGCLDSGGVAKSLVTLMNVIDKHKYDVHLLILSAMQGPFVQYLPDDITIHRDERIEGLVDGMAGLKPLVRKGHIGLAICSMYRMFLSIFDKANAGLMLAKLMPRLNMGKFDTVVDYGGQHLLYYMIDKIQGRKKISYFHNDYEKWNYYYKVDKRYLNHVNKIVLVSETCKQSMEHYFPELRDKICVIENIFSPDLLQKQSLMEVPEASFFQDNFVLITVGYVCERKGFDFIVGAANLLKRRGVKFKWVLIGAYDKSSVMRIMEEKLDDDVLLYGIRSNPYPYMRMSKIFVHPARFEGKPMVVCEAKVLCKPIVATCFSTVGDVLEDNVNASICEMNAESLAYKIEELILDKVLREKYIDYLKKHQIDNSDEVLKLYDIFEK